MEKRPGLALLKKSGLELDSRGTECKAATNEMFIDQSKERKGFCVTLPSSLFLSSPLEVRVKPTNDWITREKTNCCVAF